MFPRFTALALVACGGPPETAVQPQADPHAAVDPHAAPADPHAGHDHAPADPHAGHDHAAPAHAKPTAVRTAATNQGGKVKETMNSGGYTYVLLDACGTDTWVAGPQATVAVGDLVRFEGNMRMDGFHSPKLDRTFETVVFAQALSVSTKPIDCTAASTPAPVAPAPHALPAFNPSPAALKGTSKTPPGARLGKVLETMESGGYRYAHVDYCGTKAWVAGPSTPVTVGQTVQTGKAMPMADFHSSTLGRTFAQIDFLTGLTVVEGEPSCM